MTPTVKDVCQVHPIALDYAMGEQIENLSDVIEHTAEEARAFFAKSHITRGMELLLRQMRNLSPFSVNLDCNTF